MRTIARDGVSNMDTMIHQQVTNFYSALHPRHRFYVQGKLRWDDLSATLPQHLRSDERQSLGRLLDVGCGRGQYGILAGLSRPLDQLVGVDFDAGKIAAAQRALTRAQISQPAMRSWKFSVEDATQLKASAFDTIFLFDVLHYLDEPQQLKLAQALVKILSPGGRLYFRDTGSGLGGRVNLLIEKLIRRLGIMKGHTLNFRTSDQLESLWAQVGLKCLTKVQGDKFSTLFLILEKSE